MRDKSIIATARVRLVVEIASLGVWGAECRNDQVFKQAAEAAIDRLQNSRKEDWQRLEIRIIGEPVVTAVFAQEE